MEVLKVNYLEVIHTNKSKHKNYILNPGDSLWVKVDGEFVLGELCLFQYDDNGICVLVKAKNNMYIFSILDLTNFFNYLYDDFNRIDIGEKLFIIDDFDRDPISRGEECLLLQPSMDPRKKYITYNAIVESINPKFIRLKIMYKGNKHSVVIEVYITIENRDSFLIKKINSEEDKV